MPNALFKLNAYFKDGFWMFDDEYREIYEEPFVAGADLLFDEMSGRVDDQSIDQCSVVFAHTPIPEADVHAVLSHGDGYDGHYYTVEQYKPEIQGFQFWLCPALLAFYDEAPKDLFVKVMNSTRSHA